jgi:hypothetical protein
MRGSVKVTVQRHVRVGRTRAGSAWGGGSIQSRTVTPGPGGGGDVVARAREGVVAGDVAADLERLERIEP